jgi:hypothetical protein
MDKEEPLTAAKCHVSCKFWYYKTGLPQPFCRKKKAFCADAVYSCGELPRICINCKHCKLYRYSTGNIQYAYCAKNKIKGEHEIEVWAERAACKDFIDMK